MIVPTIEDLAGKAMPFYGWDGNSFRLGDFVYTAIEDESDGYRSHLKHLEVRPYDRARDTVFHMTPIAIVVPREVEDYKHGTGENWDDATLGVYDFTGWALDDALVEHTWGYAGTANAGDYYPMFRVVQNPLDPAVPPAPREGVSSGVPQSYRIVVADICSSHGLGGSHALPWDAALVRRSGANRGEARPAPAQSPAPYSNNPLWGAFA